eukprot:394146_1
MANSKINHIFEGQKTVTEIDLNNLTKHHRYESYSKSTLNVNIADDSGVLIESETDPPSCGHRLPIFHPFGPFRCFWDFLVMIMLVYTCVEVPVTLAFNVALVLKSVSGVISFTIDIALLIDIVIAFRTAYFDKWDRLRLIIDECSIARRYIFGWFFIDLVTSIPFEFIFQSAGDILFFVKVLRVFRFIRIIKILRLFKMIKYFDGFMSQFVTRELLLLFKFLKVFALMVLFAHICACCWFFVGYATMDNESGSWITTVISSNKEVIDNELSTFTLYSYAWYWAVVTLFTTGYGDISATHGNKAEQWLVSICILIGTCFFAYFIGTLTSLITEGDRIKSVQISKLEEAQAFCDQKKLPRELSRAVLTHIRYHFGYNYVFDSDELIESLPPYLQNDIHSFLAQSMLMQFDFLKHLNAQILGQFALKMRSISCNEKFCLFERGDRAKHIYIQRTGESVCDFHDGEPNIRMKRGHIIGETACISPKRKVTVTCDTFSEFYVICVQDIISILQNEYPNTWVKRWKKIVKNIKSKGKKYCRFVDFNKHKKKPRASNTKRSLQQWLSAGSTINTTHNKQKSVQLNAFGEVDIDTPQPILQGKPKLKQGSVSAQNVLVQSNDDHTTRSVSMATLPSLVNDVESRTKSSRFGSIFMRRNSLDRDDAIHRSARKEARGLHSRTTTNSQFRKQNSFYDISSSAELDSSDDSGDIVPIDYAEDEDEPQRNEDILDGVDNIQKLFKKQKRVKFSQLNLNGDAIRDENYDPVAPTRRSPPPQTTNAVKRTQSNTRSGGGRKGGKFGAQKRRQMNKTSQKNTRKANRHVVATHKTKPKNENNTRVVRPKLSEQETQSVQILYAQSKKEEKEKDMSDGMVVSEYSDNNTPDMDATNINSTKL